MSKRINISLVGVGYWGPNLARNIAQSAGARLASICDLDEARAAKAAAGYPGAGIETDYYALLANPEVDAVVLATPSQMHFAQTKAALLAGKHVMVEKPMAHTVEEAVELRSLARKTGRKLMVGHTFLYNNIVAEVKKRVDAGELGEVLYIYAQRLNLGRFRRDSDVVWTLAPHDVSVLNLLLGALPVRVSARGHSYIHRDSGVAEVAFVELEYPGNKVAHLHLSWLDPQKRREMVVVGSERMLVYDDMNADAHIRIYDKKAEAEHQRQALDFADFSTRLRAGDLVIPNVRLTEPLKMEIGHFVKCITEDLEPISGPDNGLQVVAALAAASRSMLNKGQVADIEYP